LDACGLGFVVTDGFQNGPDGLFLVGNGPSSVTYHLFGRDDVHRFLLDVGDILLIVRDILFRIRDILLGVGDILLRVRDIRDIRDIGEVQGIEEGRDFLGNGVVGSGNSGHGDKSGVAMGACEG
jgi:hypothetical protein